MALTPREPGVAHLRARPLDGLLQRHGGMDAVGPCLIRRARDYAATVRVAADDHRLADEICP